MSGTMGVSRDAVCHADALALAQERATAECALRVKLLVVDDHTVLCSQCQAGISGVSAATC